MIPASGDQLSLKLQRPNISSPRLRIYLFVILRNVRGDLRLWHGEVEQVDAAVAEARDARLHTGLDVRRDVQEERVVHLRIGKQVIYDISRNLGL